MAYGQDEPGYATNGVGGNAQGYAMSEEEMEKYRRANTQAQVAFVGGPIRNEPTIGDDAEQCLGVSYRMHDLINALERRLFGLDTKGEPGCDPAAIDTPIAATVRHARQRMETAEQRLASLAKRLERS